MEPAERTGGTRGTGKMPAGKQMVAPFIGLFVGSAMTFRPAMKRAGGYPCVREYQATRGAILPTKTHLRTTTRYSLALRVSNSQYKL